MPRFSDHFVKSLIRLVRQSTQVPNTSNTSAFTLEISDMFAPSLLFRFLVGRLELLAILHEPRPVRDLVVKQLRGFVGLVSHPVESAGARVARGGLDRRNQLASGATAAQRRFDEQVFKVAIADRRPGRAMQQIMCEPDELAFAYGDQRMERLDRIEEALPGSVRHFGRKLRLVEGEIALP